jgi:hypothetical protein
MALDKVTTGVIADDSVTTAKVADDAITGALIENNPTVAGNLTVAGTSTLTGNATASGNLTVTGDLVPSTPLSHRNMVINGAMQIWQRGTASTTVTSPMLLADRMNCRAQEGSTHTVERSTDVPTTGEASFTNSLKFTVGSTAGTISSSTGNNYFDYRIEGYDSARVRMGTSLAKTVTVSFWVKASVTGAYGFTLAQDTATCYATSYTVNSANTWEKKTITIPGTNSGTWNKTNGSGIRLFWNWGAGSNYTASSVGWATADDRGGYDAGSAVQLVANANATWFITGIQLELGSSATPFEHRSYAEELARCQRYYEFSTYSGVVLIGYNSTTGRGSVYLSTHKRIEGYTATVVVPDSTIYHSNSSTGSVTFTTSQHEFQCIRVNTNSAPANAPLYVNNCEIRVDAEIS